MKLFEISDKQLIVICDGTYCYIQKSANNYFQRRSYSGQKKRHLLKPFIIVCTNGRIIDIFGLYGANENDAKLIYNILKDDERGIKKAVQIGDLLILDRGFDDCIEILQHFGYQVRMPAFISNGEKQLSTKEANQTRFVTKCRWVVEVINAFLKVAFKALREVPNISLVHAAQDYRIAGALINRFFSRFLFANAEKQVEIAQRMKEKFASENKVQIIVETCQLHKKSKFDKLEDASQIDDFPRLSREEITDAITMGPYQLRQAYSYITEHKAANGRFEIMIKKESWSYNESKIVLGKLFSRHCNTNAYRTYVMYKPCDNKTGLFLTIYSFSP